MKLAYHDVQQVKKTGMSNSMITAIPAVVAVGVILGGMFWQLSKD